MVNFKLCAQCGRPTALPPRCVPCRQRALRLVADTPAASLPGRRCRLCGETLAWWEELEGLVAHPSCEKGT